MNSLKHRLRKLEDIMKPKRLKLTPDLTHATIRMIKFFSTGQTISRQGLMEMVKGPGVLPTTPAAVIGVLFQLGIVKNLPNGDLGGTEKALNKLHV